jgi:hypothetical protein
VEAIPSTPLGNISSASLGQGFLTALTYLNLYGCSTSKLGRDALKAAIPGLTISGRR